MRKFMIVAIMAFLTTIACVATATASPARHATVAKVQRQTIIAVSLTDSQLYMICTDVTYKGATEHVNIADCRSEPIQNPVYAGHKPEPFLYIDMGHYLLSLTCADRVLVDRVQEYGACTAPQDGLQP